MLAGPDYRAGRLVVMITRDEGTASDNHIPTIVPAPESHAVASDARFAHCSILRTSEELLRLSLLGCATNAPSMVGPFHLGGRG
jgi:phosphatidylinositol-3-phosphatase